VKINEVIAEGLYDFVSKLGQQKAQANWAKGNADKTSYMADYEKQLGKIHQDYRAAVAGLETPTTSASEKATVPPEGGVFLVKASNGNQYFKSYKGTWHNKGTVPDELSVGGTKITNPTEISALEALLPAAQLVGVKPDPKDNTGQAYLIDRRKTAILKKRYGKE
jgi:hypothetical protein